MIRLVSDNPNPQPHRYDDFVFIDARHEAEWAQLEQDEAHVEHVFHMMAAVYAAGFVSCLALLLIGLWLVDLAR
jgi:hypothetical protein